MVDRQFSEPALAALYDVLNNPRDDFGFYLPLVMSAQAVLDVGCGTGELLRMARERGHTGRLCGLDPAEAMLGEARRRSDIHWVNGDLGSVRWRREFDLIVMTGHAFQVFVDDHELRLSLSKIRAALTDDGRFAFETRNPLARAWEAWTPAHVIEVVDADGAVLRMTHQVHEVSGDVVSFTTTFTSSKWNGPQTSSSTLRFLGAPSVAGFLSEAGREIEVQFGDWIRHPVGDTRPEIITIARRERGPRSSRPPVT